MIGRERTGILSTNHVRAFSASFSKAQTGFKPFVPESTCRIPLQRQGDLLAQRHLC